MCVFVVQVALSLHWYSCIISYVISGSISFAFYMFYHVHRLLDNKGTFALVSMTIGYVIYMIIFGVVASLFCYIYEYRERKNVSDEEEIKTGAELTRKLLNALPEAVLLASNGIVKDWNNALLNLLDVPLDTTEVKPSMLNAIKQANCEETLENLVAANALAGSTSNEYIVKKGERNMKLTVKSVQIQHDKGKWVEHIIEDHTALEELEKAKAEKKCFYILLSTAAHDFRTPLNGLSGLLEILSGSLEGQPCLKDLRLAQGCIQRMLIYLQGLSFLNHIVTGNLQINEDEVNLRRVVEETVGLVDYSIRTRDLVVEQDLRDVPDILLLDKEKYQQILFNLIENSIKYTFKGRISVRVSYEATNAILETTVADTGGGIDFRNMRDLFKLFRKNTSLTSLNPQGIGLGLYLSKKLSKRLGGNISVETKKDVGTQITFRVKAANPFQVMQLNTEERLLNAASITPVFTADEFEELKGSITVPILKTTALSIPGKSTRTLGVCDCKRILIVDDEALNIYVLQSYLKSVGIAADRAMNGQEALSMVKEKLCCRCHHNYSVILMDINMPIMDGIECTRALQKMIAEHAIPNAFIFAVTAAAHLEDANVYAQYQTIGFTAIRKRIRDKPLIVQKPVSRDTLLNAVSSYI